MWGVWWGKRQLGSLVPDEVIVLNINPCFSSFVTLPGAGLRSFISQSPWGRTTRQNQSINAHLLERMASKTSLKQSPNLSYFRETVPESSACQDGRGCHSHLSKVPGIVAQGEWAPSFFLSFLPLSGSFYSPSSEMVHNRHYLHHFLIFSSFGVPTCHYGRRPLSQSLLNKSCPHENSLV